MRYLLCSFVIVVVVWFTPRAVPTTQAQSGSAIAYVAPSRENQQIRLINADGSDDRPVWSVPQGTPRESGIGALSWRPDGRELAFDSSHDNLRSMLVRDMYAIGPSGAGLRRVTRPPEPSSVLGNARGTVTLRFENYVATRNLVAYVEGAPSALRFTAAANEAYIITFTNVADFGPNVRQFVRVLSVTPELIAGRQCFYNDAVAPDVQPNQVVNAGLLTSNPEQGCLFAFNPSWRADGAVLTYLLREAASTLDRPNNIWQIGANPPLTDLGTRLLDYDRFVGSDKLYLQVPGPTALRDQVLYVENDALLSEVYRAPASDLANRTLINLGRCPRTTCAVLGLAWLPDGSGFVVAQQEQGSSLGAAPAAGGALYTYSFASGQLREVLRLPNEAIGQLALAPDGSRIVFERAARLEETSERVITGPRVQCPCSLWTVGADGSGLRQLVADGRAPAWSAGAPAASPAGSPKAWLPLVQR